MNDTSYLYDGRLLASPETVISMDEIDLGRNGVKHISLVDFLMNSKSKRNYE